MLRKDFHKISEMRYAPTVKACCNVCQPYFSNTVRCYRYCSFVDNVSYIVNESIRPDLIVGRNIKRAGTRMLPTRSSVGTSRVTSHKSEMCQRPAMCRGRWQSHWIIRDEKLFWPCRSSVPARHRDFADIRTLGKKDTRERVKNVDITKSRGSRQHLVIHSKFFYILHDR